MKRFGTVIKLKPECYETYKAYHTAVFPEILRLAEQCGIRNQTIYYRDGYLFRYFEYVGEDFKADMQRLASLPRNDEWMAIMVPMLQPVETAAPGELWADLEEIGHWD